MYSIYEDLVYQLEHEGTVCAACGATATWRAEISLVLPRCPECSALVGEIVESELEVERSTDRPPPITARWAR